jgi:hypothetical protein
MSGLVLRLKPGWRVQIDDAEFLVIKTSMISVQTDADVRVFHADGTLRHHSPKRNET